LNKQLAEAKRQADAAEEQIGIAKTGFEKTIRAVIATRGLTWKEPLKKDTDNVVNIVFANVGKEATAVFSKRELAYAGVDKTFGVDSIDVGINTNCDFNNYAPGTIPSFPDSASGNAIPIRVDKSDVNDILSGVKTVAMRGCLFYTEFATTHYTGYCYIAAQRDQVATLAASPLCAVGNFAK
jgi:hypothetical protein